MKSRKLSSTLLILTLTLMFASAARPKDASQKEAKKAEAGPMVINSNSLEVDNKQKIVVFTGDVNAKRDNMIINCQKMLVYYEDQPTKQQTGNVDVKIYKIIATGQVKIIQPDGATATAEKAVYFEADQKVVLTGKPVVKQGNDFVEGTSITLFLKEKRSIVEGSQDNKVRAVIFPKEEKR
jgi:lipopolysaccharide export system protein LptA